MLMKYAYPFLSDKTMTNIKKQVSITRKFPLDLLIYISGG